MVVLFDNNFNSQFVNTIAFDNHKVTYNDGIVKRKLPNSYLNLKILTFAAVRVAKQAVLPSAAKKPLVPR
jgi:hypothetical protein